MNINVTSSWDAGDPVQCVVTYPVRIDIMPMIDRPIFSDNLRVERTMRVEQ